MTKQILSNLPGYESEGMFEAAKEAEMSVSDPEEYLVSRSDEDVLFPPHSMYVALFHCIGLSQTSIMLTWHMNER